MNHEQHLINKKIVSEYWRKACATNAEDILFVLEPFLTGDTLWHGPHPINDLQGLTALAEEFYQPFFRAFPDAKREPYILLGGEYGKGDAWVSGTGHFRGTFREDWLGIPATGREATVRFGEFCRLERGKIVESYIILDIPDLMRQAGYDVLAPNLGEDGPALPPQAGDGILLALQDPDEGKKSRRLVEAMIAGLMDYDGCGNLDTMHQEDFWDVDRMIWYGPHGIGTTYGLKGFQDGHQRPFLESFPNRKGGNHKCRHGDGLYAASTGWPSVRAVFDGAPYKGVLATGEPFGMRVMDWWRREENKLVENWVLLDIVDFYHQWGVDLFERMQGLIGVQHG